MANRRMFSLDVVDTDAFLDLPISSQALYFHLGMRGDDDGFVSSPKRITAMVGANQDDLKLLIAKGFIIALGNEIVVIRHWKMNNYVRNDRYKKTVYTAEMERLSVTENREYVLADTVGIPNDSQMVYQMETQVRLDKYNNISCSPDAEREPLNEKKQAHESGEKTVLQQEKEDFEKIYAAYPKKAGRSKAFEFYRGWVGKGRVINGIRYHLDRKQIYLAVVAYVQQMEESGTQLQFYKNFDTFMNKAILDYLPEGGES